MRILITGGAGYIGTELCVQLEKYSEVDQVVVFDNLMRGNHGFFLIGHENRLQKTRFIHGDILNSRKLQEILKGVDVVIHLAGKSSDPLSSEDAHQFEQINHWGTAELSYCIENSEVNKVIYLSSTLVYGFDTVVDSVDKAITNPDTHYGVSKLNGEKYIRRLSNQLDSFILRSGNVYGFGKSIRFDTVVNRFAFDAFFSNRLTIHGNGMQKRPFVFIQNLIKTLSGLIVQNEKKPGTYNLVDHNLEINEIANVIKERYPECEFQYIAQNMKMKSQTVLSSLEIHNKEEDFNSSISSIFKHFSLNKL